MTLYTRICVFLVSACGLLAALYGLLYLADAAIVWFMKSRRFFEAFIRFYRKYGKEKGWSEDE